MYADVDTFLGRVQDTQHGSDSMVGGWYSQVHLDGRGIRVSMWVGRDFDHGFESLLRVDSDDDRLFAGIELDEAPNGVDADAPNHELHETFFELSSFRGQEELPNGVVWNHSRTRSASTDHAVININNADDLGEMRDFVAS